MVDYPLGLGATNHFNFAYCPFPAQALYGDTYDVHPSLLRLTSCQDSTDTSLRGVCGREALVYVQLGSHSQEAWWPWCAAACVGIHACSSRPIEHIDSVSSRHRAPGGVAASHRF